jgi:nucleoid-associated protein YgaU
VEVSVVTTRRVRHGIVLALAGLLAGLGIVAALFWDGGLPRPAKTGAQETPPAAAGTPSALADRLPTAPPAPGKGPAQAGAPAPDDRADRSPPAAEAPADPAADAPRFDIVRVEPNGDAVVAGRGKPNTVVEMLVDGQPVAKALTDPTGQFAIVPPPLPKGASEIVLRSKSADGRETRSPQTVAVSVPPAGDSQPLVAVTSPDAPTVVLSQPGAGPTTPPAVAQAAPDAPQAAKGTAATAEAQAAPVRIVSVDGEASGRLFVTGHGSPGSEVRLYLNDTLIAPASVGADGRVTFTIGRGIAPGRYKVRIEEVDPKTGKVAHRAEVAYVMPDAVAGLEDPQPGHGIAATPAAAPPPPPQAAKAAKVTESAKLREAARSREAAKADVASPGAVFVPAISTARITRGDNLWQISKRTYGRGQRYTVIYDANQAQIRDPDLIYPGQTFVLPRERRG